jgi:hypothetical protein
MSALSNGHAIRVAREGLRVSQTSLAREADISQSYLAHNLLTVARNWRTRSKLNHFYFFGCPAGCSENRAVSGRESATKNSSDQLMPLQTGSMDVFPDQVQDDCH